jgi:hypothetical protein
MDKFYFEKGLAWRLRGGNEESTLAERYSRSSLRDNQNVLPDGAQERTGMIQS